MNGCKGMQFVDALELKLKLQQQQHYSMMQHFENDFKTLIIYYYSIGRWTYGLTTECELTENGQIEGHWKKQKQCRKINGLNERIQPNNKMKNYSQREREKRAREWVCIWNWKRMVKNVHNKTKNNRKKWKKRKMRNYLIEFLAEVQATLNNYAITYFSFFLVSEPQRVWSVDTIRLRVKSRATGKKVPF